METIWTVLTAVLFIGLNLMGYSAWADARFREAPADAVQVEVTGVQFAWYFRYPGADGKFGKVDSAAIDASLGSRGAVGLDDTDPASADDIVATTLILPVNREVNIILAAQDVIHDFFIPAMRIKQDAVPGLRLNMHFTPTRTGEFEATCAELCGLGHYKMRSMVRVLDQQQYAAWLEAQAAELQEE